MISRITLIALVGFFSHSQTFADNCNKYDQSEIVSAFKQSELIQKEKKEKIDRHFLPGCIQTVKLGKSCKNGYCVTRYFIIQRFLPPENSTDKSSETILAFGLFPDINGNAHIIPINLTSKENVTYKILE